MSRSLRAGDGACEHVAAHLVAQEFLVDEVDVPPEQLVQVHPHPPPRPNSDAGDAQRTTKSRSLSALASPRAAEPKRRTSLAP